MSVVSFFKALISVCELFTNMPYFPVDPSSSEILKFCNIFEFTDFINGFYFGRAQDCFCTGRFEILMHCLLWPLR